MMSVLHFTKMQGTGNDFMVIDATESKFEPSLAQLQQWSDRKFGVGFDQLLLVESSERVDFRYRIFNSDGSEVEQCGNGARCFVKFVRDTGLTDKKRLTVETMQGDLVLELLKNNQVKVAMGQPEFSPALIPLKAENEQAHYTLQLKSSALTFFAVSMGNPHAVFIVEGVDSYPVAKIGPQVETHPMFPNRVNAGFMEIINRTEIKLRVFERGAGETLACGSGACAAVVCGIRQGLLENTVKVNMLGGTLDISWNDEVFLTGGAATVFKGRITI